MATGLHRRPVEIREWRSRGRIGAAFVGVVTLMTSLIVTTNASAADDDAAPDAAWKVTATSTPATGSTVAPGDEVTYKLTVQNTAEGSAKTAVTVVDDVSSVLKSAAISTSGEDLAKSGLALDPAKGTLTWTPGDLAGNETVEASFVVTVADDAADGATLSTVAAVKDGDVLCQAGDPCATELTVAVPAPTLAAAVEPTTEDKAAPATTSAQSSSSEAAKPATSSEEATASSTESDPSSSDLATSSADDPAASSSEESSTEAPTTESSSDAPSSSAQTSESAEQSTAGSSTTAEAPSSESVEKPTTDSSTGQSTTSSPSKSRAATPRAQIGAVAPQAVPTPGAGQAVITVKVGSDRTGTSGVTNLAGVTLALFDTATTTTQSAGTGNATTCTSDPAGDCSFTINNTNTTGNATQTANLNRRFYVRQITPPPAGYFANLTLGAEGTSGGVGTQTYQFQTGTQLQAGQTYTSATNFMTSTGTGYNASGGIWQNSRINPTLTAKCGLSVAIVADLSGSVGGDLPNLQGAARTLVGALAGTPSTVSLFTFATTSPAAGTNNTNHPGLQTVSTTAGVDTVNGWINGWTIPTGSNQYTNWDQAFATVANATQHYDVVVVITDGNPTVYGTNTSPVQTRFRETENGIFSANAVKAEGSRIIAMGVGAGVSSAASGLNLRAISGTTLNTDYYQSSDYTAAGNALKALALGNCLGTITVVKQVQPPGTAQGATTGGAPTGGWTFGATITPNTVTVSPASGQTAAVTGALNFNLTYPGGTTAATASIAETQQGGYTLNQIATKNAVCTRVDTGAALLVTNTTATGFSVPVSSTYPVSCTVYNIAPQPPAQIVVTKKWVVDGVTFDNGSQPAALQAALTLGGTAQDWGTTRTGLNAGNTIAINESSSVAAGSLCTITARQVTSQNGNTVNLGVPYTATLIGGANTYEITNTATCPSRLTLNKTVVNGPALAGAWTLNATAPSGALTFASGTTGVTHPVTPLTTYPLSETGGDPRYVQLVGTGASPIAGSTISWFCGQVDPTTGAPIAGFSDGLNGGVTIPRGYAVQCTAQNQTAALTLLKHVVNDNGGNKTASAWSLTATPTTPPAVPAGLVAQTVTGAETTSSANTIFVRPGQPYNLTESTVAGYTLTGISCVTSSDATTRALTQITLEVGETGTCTYTNDDQPAHLTLVKKVVDHTGADITTSTLAAQWTLTATGADSSGFSGAGNTTAVTNRPVNANVQFTLTESAVAGYTNGSAWSCVGGTFTSPNRVTLDSGVDATCTITNTEIQPRLTLVKKVFDQTGTDITTPALAGLWTLTATGTGGFSGAGNSPSIVSQPVNSGVTYTLSESTVPGYTNGTTWSCTGGGTFTSPNQIVLGAGANVTCTIGNNRNAIAVTFQKAWVDGKSGDTTDLTINGATAAPGKNTSTATGATGTQTDTTNTATATVGAGGTVNLAEVLGTSNAGAYTVSGFTCTSGTLNWTAGATTATLTAPNSGSVTCTVTNTRTTVTVNLQKTWVNGAAGDTTSLRINSIASGPGSATSTSGGEPGSHTDTTNVATLVVNSGDNVSFSETFGSANTGTYTATNFNCVEAPFVWTTGSPDASMVAPSSGSVTCTITNTRTTATVNLQKTWINGAANDTAALAINGATVAPGLATSTSNGIQGSVTDTVNVATATVFSGAAVGLAEQLGAANLGSYVTTNLVCVDANANPVTVNGWTNGARSGSFTAPASGTVTCAFSNTRTQATVTLIKHWVDGEQGDTALLGITGTDPGTLGTNTSTADGTADFTDTAHAATATIYSGGTVTFAETLPAPGNTNVGSYTSTIECAPSDGFTPGTGGQGGTLVVPSTPVAVTCTITNTRTNAALTFQKAWVNGADGDTSELGITGAVTGSATATVPSGGTGVSVDKVTVTVESGDTLNLGEVLGSGNTGSYTSAITCTPADGFTANGDGRGGVYVVPAEPVAVTCTVTNTRTSTTLTLKKSWVNGVSVNDATIAIAGQGQTGSGNVVATVPSGGTGDSTQTVAVTAYSGDSAILSETIGGPNPNYTRTLSCDGGVLDREDGQPAVLSLPTDLTGNITCTFTNTAITPAWTVAKSSVPPSGSTVQPGDTITYTLTATHTAGTATPLNITVTDDLSNVLNNAVLGSLPAGLSQSGTTLTWTIAELDTTASVSYTVTVNAGAYNKTLTNVVTPGTGGDCEAPNDCTTTHYTPHYTLSKSSVPATGSTVQPGDTISYTLTATNDSQGVVSGAEVTDDLSGVLNNAAIGTIGAGGSLTGTTLTWAIPTLQPGDDATLTYTVTVNAGAYNQTLTNVATPGPGGDCEAAADCTTTHYTPHYTLSKSSDPVTGSTVQPGDTITYTLTATNDSDGVVSGAVVTDNLAGVLNHATIGTIGSGGSLSGTTLTWAVPTLQPTDVATLTYTVTVNAGEYGVALTNVVTPGPGGDCTSTADCTTTHYTPKWELSKESDPPSGDPVHAGDTITYTLTATNVGPVAVTDGTAEDDLSQVLAYATLGPLPAELTLSGTTLTWTVPTIPVGGAVSVNYTVTVNAGVEDVVVTNLAVPTTPDGSCREASDCTTNHPVPKITKTFDTATQHKVGGAWDGTWDVAYLVAVTNPSTTGPIPYSLSDTPVAPSGGSINDATVTAAENSDTGTIPLADLDNTFTGGTLTVIADSDQRSLPADSTDTFTVVVNVAIPVGDLPTDCESEGGVPNVATAFFVQGQGEGQTTIEISDDDCGSLPEVPTPTVTKTVTSTTQQADGTWTVVYDVAVTNDDDTLATQYDLTDTLAFGAGITVNSAAVTGPSGSSINPAWDGRADTEIISGRYINAGATDHYTVTVNATVPSTTTVDDRTCTPGENGGFANVVDVALHLTQEQQPERAAALRAQARALAAAAATQHDEACSEPVSPTPAKTVVSVQHGADGTSWDVTYKITVKNPSDAANLVYTLDDTPQYDSSITVNSAEVTASSDGSGSVPGVINTWDGTTLSIVSARALAAGATDTFTIVVNATAPADLPPSIAECSGSEPGHGFFNLATVKSGDDTFTVDACAPVPGGTPHWTLVKSSNPKSGSSVDVGATITYTLTATNDSTVPVTGAQATDTLPDGVTVVTPLPAGVTNDDGVLTWSIPDIAPLSSVKVSYQVTVDSDAAGTTLKNVAVPKTPNGDCTKASDCTTTHKVKQLIVKVADDCKLDAAFLHFTISSKNVPNASSLPVTATWKTEDGTVVRVDTIPAGQLKGDLLWPGMVLNADGVAVQWPGWRELQASDFPLAADAEVYGTEIADSSLPSQAYRLPMTVTFKMNPSETVTVTYPGQTPAGCAVPRVPDLQISKVASVSTVAPGQSFGYDITVKNVSTLGVAYPVTLNDPIPANLKVTGITTATSGFPHWQDCAVAGTDADGYGGTLNCTLSASLGVSATAPVITLAVQVRSTTPAGDLSNTATTCWKNPSNSADPEKCAYATAIVTVVIAPPLPNTGVAAAQMSWLGLILLFGGALFLLVGRNWRRNPRRH